MVEKIIEIEGGKQIKCNNSNKNNRLCCTIVTTVVGSRNVLSSLFYVVEKFSAYIILQSAQNHLEKV